MFRKTGIFVFWLIIWLILALVVDNPILLVTPQAVFLRLLELLMQISFWQTIAVSLLRIGAGFLLGFLTALFLAGISLRYPMAEELMRPLMDLIKTVPVASFVVLLLIWWGSSALAVAISFLVVLPNIYFNTLEGLKSADLRLLEMAKVFQLSSRNQFFYVYRPALRPFLESGMKISLGMCWKSGVAAEVIGTPASSIGGQLYLSKIYLDTAGVLAWTGVIILLSLCFEKVILALTNRFFAWNPNPLRKRNGKTRMAGEGDCDRPHIVLEHVSKAYGEQKVLTDLSIVYESGHTYYLTSPSGSGKTTLLRLVCGLEIPDSGRIDRAVKCSMVFQEDRLCEDYNAVQNVSVVLRDSADRDRAEEALRRLLGEEALIKPCRQLSGGMKRRVALVRAMEAESDVVLLDEPFTGMDAVTRQAAEEYIRERQNGRTLILATHIS